MLQSQRRRAGFPEIMPNKSMPVIDVDKRVCSVPLEKKEERKKKVGKIVVSCIAPYIPVKAATPHQSLLSSSTLLSQESNILKIIKAVVPHVCIFTKHV